MYIQFRHCWTSPKTDSAKVDCISAYALIRNICDIRGKCCKPNIKLLHVIKGTLDAYSNHPAENTRLIQPLEQTDQKFVHCITTMICVNILFSVDVK